MRLTRARLRRNPTILVSIRNARGELLEPQQASASCAALTSLARDCDQELPFCGAVQGQYVVWGRTVYAQTPIDKLPQASDSRLAQLLIRSS
jgi:hypothetical protein